ncbi:hypothetical protein ACFX13_013617 [Malus domestica]
MQIHGRIYVVPRPPVLCINIWRRLWETTRKAMVPTRPHLPPWSKQLNDGYLHHQDDNDDVIARTPRTKQAIKALTAQIKDIALKALGTYKNCKPCSQSCTDNHEI